jgi:hypothetical protein
MLLSPLGSTRRAVWGARSSTRESITDDDPHDIDARIGVPRGVTGG